MTQWLRTVDQIIWGTPLLLLLLATGIFFTLRLGCLQLWQLPRALVYAVRRERGEGQVSGFGALCTALSSTIGTGNIVGVATALATGGPGALFWMWVAAFFGMATKFAECTLAVKYRIRDSQGQMLGGPFLYIERGLGKNWRWLAKAFALFGAGAGLLGIGTITQIHGIAAAVRDFGGDRLPLLVLGGHPYSSATLLTAVIVTVLAGAVVLGGIKRIAKVTQVVVPLMLILYVGTCLFVLVQHAAALPQVLRQILSCAFSGSAAGGGFLGTAVQMGISRGVFSNEAGLGSAPIAAAAARTRYPARQGLISMTGTFLDTIVICTMTGLTILCTQVPLRAAEGVEITARAFERGFAAVPELGSFLLTVCLIIFAFTTILGWNYYSERCFSYLFRGKRALTVFRCLFLLALLAGPFLETEAVWALADSLNGLMIFPNLLALLLLSSEAVAEWRFFRREIKRPDRRRRFRKK